MHTSSGVDAVDEYLETVELKDGKYFYKYAGDDAARGERAGDQCALPDGGRDGGEEVQLSTGHIMGR